MAGTFAAVHDDMVDGDIHTTDRRTASLLRRASANDLGPLVREDS